MKCLFLAFLIGLKGSGLSWEKIMSLISVHQSEITVESNFDEVLGCFARPLPHPHNPDKED